MASTNPDSVASILRCFDNWGKFATNVQARDKALRIFYYLCRTVYSYSEADLSDDARSTLTITMRTTSLSRKAFRLLKSLDHVNLFLRSMDDVTDLSEKSVEALLFTIENIFWSICYWHDNMLFLTRTKILKLSENAVVTRYYRSWCIGDIFQLIGNLVKMRNMRKRLKHLRSMELRFNALIRGELNSDGGREAADSVLATTNLLATIGESSVQESTAHPFPNGKVSDPPRNVATEALAYTKAEITTLESELRWTTFRTIKSILNITVSGDYAGVWKTLFGSSIHAGHVSLLGMISSSMNLYDILASEKK